MTMFPTIRVAAIQATPVILNADGCVDKAVRLLHKAADRGAQLVVLPECFIPLYPSNAWARGASGFGGWDGLWERLWANSVDVPGPRWIVSWRFVASASCSASWVSTSESQSDQERSTTR
jgi:hypothetical protein